jgi:hypothetical protein
MKRKYETAEDVLALVRSFEAATISRDEWKHPEHLIVALYYVSHYDVETAIKKMRSGILNLLANGFKVDLTKEMPYHETITIFWIRSVAAFHKASNGKKLSDMIVEMVSLFNKEYLLTFYSRELIFSVRARSDFVEPDLAALPVTNHTLSCHDARATIIG